MADRGVNFLDHLVLIQRSDVAVQRRGADEGVDARASGVFHGLPAAVNIRDAGAGQTANHRVLGLRGDGRNGGKIPLRGDRETGFDNIDAHLIQQPGDF